MKYQAVDYRVSLLSAAAFHGASHQAATVFQVIVPRQLRDFVIGRHRLELVTQARALDTFAAEAKSVKLLDPSSREAPGETSGRWKIAVNGPVEFDS